MDINDFPHVPQKILARIPYRDMRKLKVVAVGSDLDAVFFVTEIDDQRKVAS